MRSAPEPLHPPLRDASRCGEVGRAGPSKDVVDLRLEGSAVSFRRGFELLQKLVVKITDQHVRHDENFHGDGIILILFQWPISGQFLTNEVGSCRFMSAETTRNQ